MFYLSFILLTILLNTTRSLLFLTFEMEGLTMVNGHRY
jgi:hypothetical protein